MTLRTRARRTERPRPFLLSLLLLAAVSAAPLAASLAARQDDETAAAAASPRAAKSDGAEFVPGEALVRFRGEAEDGAEAEVEIEDGSRFGSMPGMGFNKRKVRARFNRFDGSEIVAGLRLAKLTADSASADAKQTLAAIAELNRRPDVLYAEPNYIWRAKATRPNDERYKDQYAMERISAPDAWDKTVGSQSVVVAVIDSGVNLQHPDLQPNAWVNPIEIAGNGLDDDQNGFADDINGWDFSTCTANSPDTPPEQCGDNTVFDSPTDDSHGTHVAGIIGARGNNGIGVTGVNWEVKIMSVKVLGPGGGDTADIIRGYRYVQKMRELWAQTNGQKGANVRVTNNSYGGPGKSNSALAAINALNSAGILFVAAAGNDARDNFSIEEFPSNYDAPNVLAVASTNTADPDGLSSFSNFSSRLVSMGAPGSNILSTFPNNSYQYLQGTSMASPHVAGAAALVCSVVSDCANKTEINSGIPVAQLRGLLAFTGDRIAALQDNTTTGRRLNVNNAVVQAQTADNIAPGQTTMSVASQSGRSLTLSFIAPGDDNFTGTAADYDFFFVNPALNVRVLMPTNVAPAPGGTQQQVAVETPLRNFSGTVELVAYDEHGNRSVSTLAVNVPQNAATDPYVVTASAHESLTTTGTRLAIEGDDKYFPALPGHPLYQLPFAFPFYGQQRTQLTISTNGVLYFSTPPRRDNQDADDVPSSVAALQGQTLIAPLWDDIDLRTCFRPDAGVYEIREAQRLVLRWQGVTFQSLNCPASPPGSQIHVNFEVELRADGVISFRYGAENRNLFPVVAISGGEPSAYVVASHTYADMDGDGVPDAFKNLTDAQTVRFTPRAQGGFATLQFNTTSFSESEAAGRALLTVTRSGDPSVAGSVQVRTVDNTAPVRCDDTTTLPGVAFARCDYATTVETLSFAPGELSKTFTVPLVNDAHVEPSETVQVILHSPAGNAVLGTQTTLTLTIISDDAGGAANPIDGPPHDFFVRQHYLDFLSREPEPSGLQAWLNVLNNCPNAYNHDPLNASAACDRNTVSSAFFRSEEFEIKGAYVFRLYRVGLGRLPLYNELIPDMRAVTGQTPQEVFAKKAAFAEQFVQRWQELQTSNDPAGHALFVNRLMDRYQLQQITTPDPAAPDGDVKVVRTRQQLIDMLTAGTLTRGKVLRAVADSEEVERAERDRTFVAMQYFGYLRRDPDQGGFDSWMEYLRTHPGDYYTMVNGFLYSTEYRLRFGAVPQ